MREEGDDDAGDRTDLPEIMRPVLRRLQTQARLSAASVSRIKALGSRVETVRARSVLQDENLPPRRPRYLIQGWACRLRHLSDGRRQIFDWVLPGEGVGLCPRSRPLSQTDVLTLTSVKLVEASALIEPEVLAGSPDLRLAIQEQADLDERRLLDQVVRLGRLTAIERVAHLLLDLHDRLDVVGLVDGDRFELPLTQEVLADMAGLSIVHVNRTLQELRRQKLLNTERGHIRLPDRRALEDVTLIESRRTDLRRA